MKKKMALISATAIMSLSMATSISYADWKQSNDGRWWYETNTSQGYYTGWNTINGKWYYFDNNGYMKTGWLKDGNDWYFLDSDGSMKSDCYVDGYYLSSSGKLSSNDLSLESFKEYEQQYLYTMAGLASTYRFNDTSSLTDTQRIDMVFDTAEFTYYYQGGCDLLETDYYGYDSGAFADPEDVHIIAYQLTNKIPEVYKGDRADFGGDPGGGYWNIYHTANGRGKCYSITFSKIEQRNEQYIINYTRDYWQVSPEYSIDYSARKSGTFIVKRNNSDQFPFMFVSSK